MKVGILNLSSYLLLNKQDNYVDYSYHNSLLKEPILLLFQEQKSCRVKVCPSIPCVQICLELLIENGFVQPEATLKETYEKVIGIYNIVSECIEYVGFFN